MTELTESKATERLRVEVTLTVKHRVSVTMDGNSGQTMEELKQAALDEFHRDPNARGQTRTDDKWRAQFSNRSNISVGGEVVAIAGVSVQPKDGQR